MIRSLLFVPAKENKLNKIPSLSSDGYIIDLEDSIIDSEKEEALKVLCSFLTAHQNIPNLFVRLNKDRFKKEAIVLDQFRVGFMLPKFEIVEDYSELKHIWNLHCTIALVETPMGIINIRDIVQCPWITSLAFGAEDYTASMNMQNQNDLLLPIKSSLVTYAKAYNKIIYDTPSFNINNQDAFEKDVSESVSLGFNGKLLIHPKQIEFVNKTFGEIDLDYLAYIISEYEKKNNAVSIIDGKIYEKMHIDRYRRIISENNEHKNIEI